MHFEVIDPMWTSLALLATLTVAPAADESLKLSNTRLCYGAHGPTRKSSDLLPGDSLDIAYTINGLATDNEGKVKFTTTLEIATRDGKSIFKDKPSTQEALLILGGNQWPALAHVDIGLDTAPGDYKVILNVTDEKNKQTQILEQPFQVLKPAFGIVRLTTTYDNSGRGPISAPGTGETVWLNFAVVNFARSNDSKQPNVSFELKILDEQGNATTAKPLGGAIKEGVPANEVFIPAQFQLPMNRAGKFKVVAKSTCELSKQTSEITIPISVSPQQQ